MRTSEAVDLIFTALFKAQGEFKVALKGSENPFFKSNYADFESVVGAARPALSKNGLAFIQMPSIENDKTVLVTRITHSSGQWFEDSMPIKATKDDAQGLGSAITYTRRYALQAALGIVTSNDDDDAEKTMNRDKTDRTASKADVTHLLKAFQKEGVTEKQVIGLLGISDAFAMTEAEHSKMYEIGTMIHKKTAKASDYFK